MATATEADIVEFTRRLLDLEAKQPSWVDNYINKYNGGRKPYDPWPPEEEEVQKFLQATNPLFQTPEERAELANTIDPKKLDDIIAICNEESGKVASVHTEAERKARTSTQELIRLTLEQKDVDPKQKELFFRELKSQSEKRPDRTIAELVPETIATGEAFQPFLKPDIAVAVQGPLSFTQIKELGVVQRAITAPILDIIYSVSPGLKPGVMNRTFEDAFRKLIDVPERLTRLFGSGVVESRMFQQMLDSAKKALPVGSKPGGAKTVIDDVVSSLFRRAPEPALVAYWELYRVNIAQGLPPPSLAQFQASSMGIGSSLFHTAVNIGVNKTGGALVKAGLSKLGLAVGEAAVPGVGWAALLLQIGGGLLKRVGGWLKGFAGIKEGLIPGDKEILAVGCGAILLIFFILPVVSQLNIDSSLVTRFAGGPETPSGGAPSLPPYGGAPPIPSEITGCPTKSAFQLTQCPGGSYSHKSLCAYDIGLPMGQPIVAPHDGVIAVTTNAAQSGGYGNMIEIKGVTPGGQTYYTLYGHLATFAVRPGQEVRAGQIIGYSDNTGHSSGPHLHFEYRGASNNAIPNCGNQFLPSGCVNNPGYCNLK